MALRFKDIQELYLFDLYKETMARGGKCQVHIDWNPLASIGINYGLIEKCTVTLKENGFIIETINSEIGYDDFVLYEITGKGLDYIEEQIDDEENPINSCDLDVAQHKAALIEFAPSSGPSEKIVSAGNEPFEHEKSSIRSDEPHARPERNMEDENTPAADRYVSRSDNEDAWIEAITALDDLISEADKSNDFGDLSDPEIEQTKAILKAGRKLFDQAKVRVESITTSLLPTLNWLKSHLDSLIVGTLSAVAAAAIIALFGLA
ncbi:MAG: hypothetical protein V3S92_07435 [Alphaproteobacteria bacterium]